MRQINGPGSTVMIISFLLGALFAECIPLMLVVIAIGVGVFVWDRLHGNFSE